MLTRYRSVPSYFFVTFASIVFLALAAVYSWPPSAEAAGKKIAGFEREHQSWMQNGRMHYEGGEYGKALLCFIKAERLKATAEAADMIARTKKQLEMSNSKFPLKPIPVSEERKVHPRINPEVKAAELNPEKNRRTQFFRKNFGYLLFPDYTMNLRDGEYFDAAPAGADGKARAAAPGQDSAAAQTAAAGEEATSAGQEGASEEENLYLNTDDLEGKKLPDVIQEYFVEDEPETYTPQTDQVVLRKGKRHGKMVALTFDDGPHPTYTRKILKILSDNEAPATFFMLGSRMAEYGKIATQVAKEGHEIGNHSYSHPFYKKIKTEKIDREVARTDELIRKVTGRKRVRYYRPPYGSLPKYFIQRAENEGFKIVMWSLDSKDYQGGSPDRIIDKILKYVRGGDVILFHDIHPNTVHVIAELVPILKKAGFSFVSLDEIYGFDPQEPVRIKPEGTAEVALAGATAEVGVAAGTPFAAKTQENRLKAGEAAPKTSEVGAAGGSQPVEARDEIKVRARFEKKVGKMVQTK